VKKISKPNRDLFTFMVLGAIMGINMMPLNLLFVKVPRLDVMILAFVEVRKNIKNAAESNLRK
jgi:hypothetical protein